MQNFSKPSQARGDDLRSASRCICTRVLVHFLTGRRAHNVGPSPLPSPPPPRAPSLPSPTRRLASQALALTGGYPHQHAARTARPTPAPPPRSCMGCARGHARPRAVHACDPSSRCHAPPPLPSPRTSRSRAYPCPSGASGTRIGDRAPRGGLEEVGRGAGDARQARQAGNETDRPNPRRSPRRRHSSGRPHLPAAACPVDLVAPFSLA